MKCTKKLPINFSRYIYTYLLIIYSDVGIRIKNIYSAKIFNKLIFCNQQDLFVEIQKAYNTNLAQNVFNPYKSSRF